MERIFCKDKKDFCDGAEDCTKCQYAKGNGLIAGYVAHDLLCTLFGNNYDLDRLRELVKADREGRCVVLPCHIGDPVFMGMGRSKITGYEEDICDGFYIGRDGVLQVKSQCLKGNHGTYGVIGQSAELTSEAAKAALEKMKEREEK